MQTTRRGLDALVNRNSRIVLSTNNRSFSPINMMPAKLVDQTGGSGNPIFNTPPPMPHPRLRRVWLSPVCPVSASSFLRPSRPSASGPCSCPSDHPCLPLNVSLRQYQMCVYICVYLVSPKERSFNVFNNLPLQFDSHPLRHFLFQGSAVRRGTSHRLIKNLEGGRADRVDGIADRDESLC